MSPEPARRRRIGGVDMRSACDHVKDMGVMVQIRNVPEDVHRRLKSRAALAGLSLSDYLLRQVREASERPTLEEMVERLRKLPHVDPAEDPVTTVRRERDRA